MKRVVLIFILLFAISCKCKKIPLPPNHSSYYSSSYEELGYHPENIMTLVDVYDIKDTMEIKFSERIYRYEYETQSWVNKNTNEPIEKKAFIISIADFIKDYKIENNTLRNNDGKISAIDVIRYEKDKTLILLQLKVDFTDVEFKKG